MGLAGEKLGTLRRRAPNEYEPALRRDTMSFRLAGPSRSGRIMEQIVILGGGFAGLTLATELDRLAAEGKAEVTLVERNASFQMGFSMQWVLAGRRTPEQGQRSYSDLRAPHVRFLPDQVASTDTNARTVHSKAHELKYDRLVVALGAELALELVPGLA